MDHVTLAPLALTVIAALVWIGLLAISPCPVRADAHLVSIARTGQALAGTVTALLALVTLCAATGGIPA